MQYLLRVTLTKINFWSEVLPQCILQLLSKKTFSSPRLQLRGFLSYLSSSSTITTLIAHINSRVPSAHLPWPQFIHSKLGFSCSSTQLSCFHRLAVPESS